MSRKFFFNRDKVRHGNLEVGSHEGKTIDLHSEQIVEVADRKNVLEEAGSIFHMNYEDILELYQESKTFNKILAFLFRYASKNSLICTIMFTSTVYSSSLLSPSSFHGHIALVVINETQINPSICKKKIESILKGEQITGEFSKAKFSLMFDYEYVSTDVIDVCFGEINQRKNNPAIPLYSYMSSEENKQLNLKPEVDSIHCQLTKLLIFISEILEDYFGTEDYMQKFHFNSNDFSSLVEEVTPLILTKMTDLENGPVHKIEKEIHKFIIKLVQLEYSTKIKCNSIDIKTQQQLKLPELQKCVTDLSSLFYKNLIPPLKSWVKFNSKPILSQIRENWKKCVIWPNDMDLPLYYEQGEFKEFTWVLVDLEEITRPIIKIHEYFYHLGTIEITPEKKKLSMVSNIKSWLRPKEDKLFIHPCLHSSQHITVWLCRECWCLIRASGTGETICNCGTSKFKNCVTQCYHEIGAIRTLRNLLNILDLYNDVFSNTDNETPVVDTEEHPPEPNHEAIQDQCSVDHQSSVEQEEAIDIASDTQQQLPQETCEKKNKSVLLDSLSPVNKDNMIKEFSFLQNRRRSHSETEICHVEYSQNLSQEKNNISSLHDPADNDYDNEPKEIDDNTLYFSITHKKGDEEIESNISSSSHQFQPSSLRLQEFTVIFLGESGVGKSTLISGLGNYLNWPTFEEAKKNQMQVCIPLQFQVQRKGEDNKIIETIVTAGNSEENENFNDVGQSVTQKPKVHEFTFQSNKIKVIDTPGLSEYGNSDLDKEKLNLIRNCVHEQENIHAICIALKSDGSTLNNHYIVTLRWLLSIFPKIALSNVFFFFTHADRTRFETETTLELLQEVQQRLKDIYGEIFKLQSWNTYSVDSESFKYLLSKEQGVKYSNRAEKYFVYCWEETSSQIQKFLNCITTIRPINKEVIINVHKLKASDSQLRIQGPIKTEDEPVISKGMDKLQFMIMKHSLVTPRYSPMSEDVKMEELFTDLDEMAPVIEKYRPGVLERIPEIKKVIYYFENLQ